MIKHMRGRMMALHCVVSGFLHATEVLLSCAVLCRSMLCVLCCAPMICFGLFSVGHYQHMNAMNNPIMPGILKIMGLGLWSNVVL